MFEPLPSAASGLDESRRRFLRSAIHLSVALLAAGTLACGATGSGGNPFAGGAGEGTNALRIEVQNLNFNDATLHVVSSGSRRRLGTVSGKSNATFEVPWQGQQALRIEIDLLAGDRYTTRPVSVTSRDRVQLYIQPDLHRSYVQI